MGEISILVVDDHAVFADALQARLADELDLGPVSVAYSAAQLRAHLARSKPAVIVLDLMLADRTGLDLADDIRELSPTTRTVILTAMESVEPVFTGLTRGVRAWLPKTIDTDRLVRVIRGVCAGEAYLAPDVLGRVLSEMAARTPHPALDPFAGLTIREREVLQCMVDGLTRAEIAARLGVSVNTARTHAQNLIAKLGTHSTLETVSLALRNGIRASGYPAAHRVGSGV
ncbi:response regulator transcription factor [Dactylosporangium sp. CA-233914]|uniref:response regulator transcription factor n=1 Tax=Dactylosporangium sp. CA-233914 TaxID=3239934 RepID=UPI003D8B8B69